ncbi:MAG: DUF1176 domain-containing protein [Sphingobium sp.]
MGAMRFFAIVAALGSAATAGAQAPRPGTIEIYRDWAIGCDNRGRCEALSLMPEDATGTDPRATIGLTRDPGAPAEAEVWASFDGKGRQDVAFAVDGRKVTTATATDGELALQGPQATALAVAVARGGSLELRVGGKLVGRPSLFGSGAALRYMDAQQGRAGTVSALIATGPLSRAAVRNAPIVPIVRRASTPAGTSPAALWREELTSAGKLSGCTDEMKNAEAPGQYRLSPTETLILIPCGSGAYNFTSVPIIATGTAGRRAFRLATFDYQPGWSEDPKKPMLVNAGWDAGNARLDSYAKGRGVGDCGGSEAYVWDGTRFRLVEASAMSECRGAPRWITTWTARVVE